MSSKTILVFFEWEELKNDEKDVILSLVEETDLSDADSEQSDEGLSLTLETDMDVDEVIRLVDNSFCAVSVQYVPDEPWKTIFTGKGSVENNIKVARDEINSLHNYIKGICINEEY